MSADHAVIQDVQPAPPWLKALGWSLTAVAAAILLANAGTTSIWEDESNGFFLSTRPLGELVSLMANNAHEDPPLYDLLMHGWLRLTGYNVLLLRSLSIAIWLLMLPALFLCARLLAGDREAWVAVSVAAMMPHNWLCPASLRWYSLFACLCMWNFYFFLHLNGASLGTEPEEKRTGARFARTMPYWLSGAALWYTNYSAPVVFFTHLLIVLFRCGPKRRIVLDLVISWMAIGLLYAPWLPTFCRQLGASPKSFSLINVAMSVWVMFAGEFSTPLDLGMALPVAALTLALAVLVVAQWRKCWVPVVVAAVVFLVMCLTGVIWTRRVLFLSPFVAMAIALALCRRKSDSQWLLASRVCLVGLLLAVSSLSFSQMIRRTEWLSYRWLDPCRQALERVRDESPEALILTNSNPVFFYLEDRYGKGFPHRLRLESPSRRPAALVYPFKNELLPEYEPLLAEARSAAYIHQAAYEGPITASYGELVRQMEKFGFRPVKTEGLLRASPEFLRYHPFFKNRDIRPIDEHRIVVVHFAKPGAIVMPHPDHRVARLDRDVEAAPR